jgi:Ca-activated chloride channel homolog
VARLSFIVAIVVILSPSLGAQAPAVTSLVSTDLQAGQTAAFRSGIELVALTVTVTDNRQRFVNDLSASNFAVLEDGVRQTVAFFGTNDVPLDLAVVIDGSGSMQEKLEPVQEAASGLVRHLRQGDRASLVEFHETVSISEPMTTDVNRVVARLKTITPHGRTGLYDALYVTLRGFADAPPTDVRRRAIVVLTDGEDTTSVVSYDDVLDLAKRSAIAVYTITFDDSEAMNRRRFSASAFDMRHLAEQTGALSFFATGAAEVRAIYESIASELSSQYAIGYTSQNASLDGGWRRVVVQVMDRPGVRARSRQGYYAIPSVESLSSLLRH